MFVNLLEPHVAEHTITHFFVPKIERLDCSIVWKTDATRREAAVSIVDEDS
jgi:hypothetical protein